MATRAAAANRKDVKSQERTGNHRTNKRRASNTEKVAKAMPEAVGPVVMLMRQDADGLGGGRDLDARLIAVGDGDLDARFVAVGDGDLDARDISRGGNRTGMDARFIVVGDGDLDARFVAVGDGDLDARLVAVGGRERGVMVLIVGVVVMVEVFRVDAKLGRLAQGKSRPIV
jgi:hypothetical protein